MIYPELVENEFLSPQVSKQIKIDTVFGNTYDKYLYLPYSQKNR
jgi:hypothetical protein